MILDDKKEWFSATVRVIAVVQGIGAVDYMDCIHLFRAQDEDEAFDRAMELGRTHETQYINGEGNPLKWRLKEIRTLDRILANDLDGAEIRSQFIDVPSDEQASFETEFHPEMSQPHQTL
jgi:hypothetical protein